MTNIPNGVHVLNHPLAKSFLAEIRDVQADRATMRHHIRALAVMSFYEASRDLPTEAVNVRTPLAEADGEFVGVVVGLVPILRAGLGMVDAVLQLLPHARCDLRRFQTMPAQFEKRFGHADAFPSEHFRPNRRQCRLDRIARRDGLGCHALGLARHRQRPTIHLPVRRQRQRIEHRPRAGHHVVGQTLA